MGDPTASAIESLDECWSLTSDIPLEDGVLEMSLEGKSSEELRAQLQHDYQTVKGFADVLRRECDPIWRQIDTHPFLLEIAKGTFPLTKYKTYAIQNYFYFTEWFRCCAAAASRAHTTAETLTFKKWMTDTNPEFERYVAIIKQVGLTDKELEEATVNPAIPLPAARAYVDFSYKVYSTGTPAEMAAAILPCAWSYAPRDIGGLACPLRVAKGLADHYGVDRQIALAYGNYSNQHEHFELMISLKDTMAREAKERPETSNQVRDIFRRCSEYEYMWWDLAYRHEPGRQRQIGSYF
jgi:thiaminase/transcriptional activator TenA